MWDYKTVGVSRWSVVRAGGLERKDWCERGNREKDQGESVRLSRKFTLSVMRASRVRAFHE